MNLRLKMALGAATGLFGCLCSLTPSAAATTGAATAAGSGTITPGLTLAGGPQSVTYSGTMVVGSTSTASHVTFTCFSSDSTDTIGSLVTSSGAGTMYCTSTQGGGTSSGPYTYARSGLITRMNGIFSIGPLAGTWTAVCTYIFANAQTNATVNGYEMQCQLAWV